MQRNARRIRDKHRKAAGKTPPAGSLPHGKSHNSGPRVTRLAVRPWIRGEA